MNPTKIKTAILKEQIKPIDKGETRVNLFTEFPFRSNTKKNNILTREESLQDFIRVNRFGRWAAQLHQSLYSVLVRNGELFAVAASFIPLPSTAAKTGCGWR